MAKHKTVDDYLTLYISDIVRLVESDSIELMSSEIKRMEDKIIKPMMDMYNKLPLDIRMQFLKSKCGNVKSKDGQIVVEVVLQLK